MDRFYWDHPDTRDHDRPLSFHWQTVDFVHLLSLPRACNAQCEATINAILAEAILAAEVGQRVSYSARYGFYSDGQRYRGTSFTYATVMAAIELLHREGWIIDCRVQPGNRGWQSSFVATEKLLAAWHSYAPQLAYDANEIIRLKDADGKLVDYTESRNTTRMRRRLEEINQGLAGLQITIPGAQWQGHHMLVGGGCVLPLPGNGLWRVFSRGRWSLHGRAYGWFQSIPRTVRLTIKINGEPVVELDYSCLHVNMLYNQAGVRLTGDAYDIDGIARPDVKAAVQMVLNACDTRSAIGALAANRGMDRRRAADIITAVKKKHRPIKQWFCGDAGIRLMRADSEVILDALKTVNDYGDPALPIHDALIVPARCADRAKAAMEDTYRRIVGNVSPSQVKEKRSGLPETSHIMGSEGGPLPASLPLSSSRAA
jgi:hypothetical protein